MIELKQGDLRHSAAEALVNTVNCVGVMGRALQFRKAFPESFAAYNTLCERGGVKPGRMMVYDLGRLSNPRYVINFPTKRHWKDKSRMEDIEAGLTALVEEVRARNLRSIAIPPLGCGLGKGPFHHPPKVSWCGPRTGGPRWSHLQLARVGQAAEELHSGYLKNSSSCLIKSSRTSLDSVTWLELPPA